MTLSRRSLILSALAAPLAGCSLLAPGDDGFTRELARIETESRGRLGVAAFDTGRKKQLSFRGDERFPMASTFKVLLVSSILAREPALLDQRIRYARADLVPWSPVTEKHLAEGMTVAQLCAAALQYSDNTAANLLMKQVGGPAGVTAHARALGDEVFRLDRWETELNSAIPGDERDTTSPVAMMRSLQKVAVDGAPARRKMLVEWMLENTTGGERIRAGVPAGWKVADKTGSGAYGSTNTIAVVYPPARSPIVIAVYFAQSGKDANTRSDVVAAATRAIVAALA